MRMMKTPDEHAASGTKDGRINALLCEVFGGDHHVRWEKVKYEPFEQRSYCFRADCSTFDGDLLTRIVVAAHRFRVRVEIMPGGTRLKLWMSARSEDGAMHERHPGLAALAERTNQ